MSFARTGVRTQNCPLFPSLAYPRRVWPRLASMISFQKFEIPKALVSLTIGASSGFKGSAAW